MDIWVALPDSSLVDADTLEEKSRKIAIFARIFAIFRVKKVIIYNHHHEEDGKLLKFILEFMNTPPYLRKSVYKKTRLLRYAGLFEPLKAPHHKPYKRLEDIKIGEVRQGLVIKRNGRLYVDVGLDALVPLETNTNKRIVNVIFTSPYPDLRCRIARDDEIVEYWGYEVIFYNKLSNILENFKDLIILTSKKGKFIDDKLIKSIKESKKAIVVFGSTKQDIKEILESEKYNKRLPNYYNFFPNQGVESIRIEEAMLGTLSIINYLLFKD